MTVTDANLPGATGSGTVSNPDAGAETGRSELHRKVTALRYMSLEQSNLSRGLECREALLRRPCHVHRRALPPQ